MDELTRTRKVLYITYDGLTDALGQSQILSYLSRLSHQGNEFFILSFEKEANYRKNEASVEKKTRENNLHWIKKWYTKSPPVFSTLYDMYQAIKEADKLHLEHQFDIVHCRGYVPALIGLRLKKKFGIKFIFDMRGWWPDEKVESGSWAKPIFKPIYNYFKQKEREFFQEADFSVSLTEAGKEEILQNFNIPEKRVGVVPTCVNFDVFRSRSEEKSRDLRKSLGIHEEAKVLVYSGALGGNYDLDILLSVFRAFNAVYADSFILILSKDKLTQEFELQLKDAGIVNYALRNVTYTEVSDYLCLSDAGLIFYKSAFSNIGRSPTKLGEYWASGIPVIATEGIGDLDLLQKKYPDGVLLFNKNMSDISQKLLSLNFNNHNRLREYAIDYCSLDKGISFYQSVYQQLTQSN
jgi:glycosyltransferase involved in cell wall biosynthesis